MKIKTILLGAALAATIPTNAAQSHFVIFDSLLRVPALCYPLPSGWTGMGWVKWNVPAPHEAEKLMGQGFWTAVD